MAKILLTVFILSLWSTPLTAKIDPVIPDQLKPWVDWVLYGHEEKKFCSPSYNNQNNLQCDWPSKLYLTVSDKQGSFIQDWFVQQEKWIQLPGNSKNWPQDVLVNGKPALVLNREETPAIQLSKGKHTITGQFTWTTIPEYLTIPSYTGIVSLKVNNKNIDFPNIDQSGRLWLQAKKGKEVKIEDRLTLQCFRLIDDRIPQRMVTALNLDVSGAAREVVLGPLMSTDRFIPVSLSSSLPARLEPDGRLRVQVRPGQWNLTLTTRHTGQVASIRFDRPDDKFWPNEEIWVFNSHPNLRVVEIEGVPSIDPLQTSLPEHWRNYPAYRILDGDTITFKEIKRGDPHPAPDQLTLQRNLWLRFDGSGYTIQDLISGIKTSQWRLEMNPPIHLGRVAVDGREQFITQVEGTEKTGVELRKGVLDLTADSLYAGSISKLPATGWDHDFEQVSAQLSIPPGWRLINASGVDNISGTWVKRWTLLDFFLVLIFTIAVAKLYSKPLAALAFVSLVLMYHEPNSPRWIWLAILIGVALLRYLPEGKFRLSIKVFQFVNILILIGMSIPFSIQQLRTGIYPQLEKPWQSMISLPRRQVSSPVQAMKPKPAQEEAELMDRSAKRPIDKIMEGKKITQKADISSSRYGSYSVDQVAQYDPSMINQTGPGLPYWQWNTFSMNWSGPVQRSQEISFILTGPKTNLALSFFRVFLLIALILGLFNIGFRKGGKLDYQGFKLMLFLPFILVCINTPTSSRAGEIPSPQMLDELRSRLLTQEECFPHCADIGSMDLNITPEQLRITLNATSQTEVSVPLPGSANYWLPQKILLDNEQVDALFRTDETLWMLLPPGNHTILLSGKLPKQNTIQLPLPLKPHRVTSTAVGWTVEGIHENGRADNQIQFKRIIDRQDVTNQILETGILPPFLLIDRTLHLGLTWKIETTVRRISPVGSAVIFNYPLLPGESILTEGIRVRENQAQVNMDSETGYLRWDSTLEKSGELLLKHADTTLWTETWRVDVSPIFHVETSGIPVILHQQGNRWHPTWHPWPNDEVRLVITRPQGVEGQTITIDKTHLEIRPGQRATNTQLNLSVRSSQGGQHIITLPEKAQLQEVKINGQVQPIRQENRNVPLPIRPGKQEITLQWSEAQGIVSLYKSPEVDLGIESVNDHIDIHLPQNRWPLFMGGPLMGPAVLFWSVVLIIILVTFGLSRSGFTPLKFHHWFLLGIGMSQSNLASSVIVAGWLIVLDLRRRVKPDINKISFNVMQIGIAMFTVLALGSLILAISQGLLGHPDMNIVGNGSHSGLLRWYDDHSGKFLPQAWVLSIPMFVYRLAMLAWALWLSFYLISLLKWGWNNYTEPVIWHKIPRKKKPRKTTKENVTNESQVEG